MDALDFQTLVDQHYQPLYRFALSLSQNEAEACDLSQQTFYLWAKKGHQLRDLTKVKSWLFTTLHREFLGARRHDSKFQHQEIESVSKELPSISPADIDQMDTATLMRALAQIDDLYRIPLTLFYIGNHTYQEMSDILDIPANTLMTRVARGKQQLREALLKTKADEKIVSVPPETWRQHNG